MTQSADIRRLQALAQLMLDRRMLTLTQAAQRLERSQQQMAAINAAAAPAGLEPVTAGLVDVAYRRWADVRRAELNTTIAQQTGERDLARSEAQLAFGRLQALEGALKRVTGSR